MVIGTLRVALTLAEQTNVMLDIKPRRASHAHSRAIRAASRAEPTGIRNDAGVVLTETTIKPDAVSAQGTPIAFRARMAIQYGGNIDEVVKYLGATTTAYTPTNG